MARPTDSPHLPPEQTLEHPTSKSERATSDMLDAYEVYLQCIEDTLLSIEGLNYSRAFRELDLGDVESIPDEEKIDLTCVTFSILCNPAHDLRVSLQLRPEVFSLEVNGQLFEHRCKRLEDIVTWTEQQCERVEKLFQSNLKLQVNRFAGMPLRTEVSAGPTVEKLETIVKRQDPVATVLASVLPFGFALTSEKATVYNMWYRVDVEPRHVELPTGPEAMALDSDDDPAA